MVLFAEKGDVFQRLIIIFAKSPILDVWQCSEYASCKWNAQESWILSVKSGIVSKFHLEY